MEPEKLGTLIVIFAKARNLPNRRTLGKQNPYCIARIGHTALRCTADIRGGQTPVWDHEVRFDVLDIEDHRKLKLSVLDENDSKVDLIGDTTIPLEEAFKASPKVGFDKWHELYYRGKYAGEVYLEMTFYPTKPALPAKRKIKKKRSSLADSQSSSGYTSSVSSKASLPSISSYLSMDEEEPAITPLPRPPAHRAYGSNSNYNYLNMSTLADSLPDINYEPSYSTGSLPQLPGLSSSRSSRSLHSSVSSVSSHSSVASTSSRASVSSRSLPQIPGSEPEPVIRSRSSSPVKGIPTTKGTPTKGQVPRKPVKTTPTKQNYIRLDDNTMEPVPYSAFDYQHDPYEYGNGAVETIKARKNNNKNKNKKLPIPGNADEIYNRNAYAAEPRERDFFEPPASEIEPGLGGYAGNGQWDISKQLNDGYSQSVYNKVVDHSATGGLPLPRLPPKVPLGMSMEEYLAAEPAKEQHPFYYE